MMEATVKGDTLAAQVPGERSRVRWLGRWLRRDKASLFGLIVLLTFVILALFPGLVTSVDPATQDLTLRRQPPSSEHPFGMDQLGRDILSRIVYGARYTLGAGFFAVSIGAILGVPIGLVAGFFGRFLDSVLMRGIDALLSFPYFLVAIMLVAAFGAGLVTAVIAVGLTMIPMFARVTRGSVLSLKNNDFVMCADAIGCSVPRIMFRHVLPNALSPLIILSTLNMATGILAVAALGFLGLGMQPPTPEWGLMLSTATGAMTVAPHVMIFPGVAIALVVTAFNLLGDGIREMLDPRMRV